MIGAAPTTAGFWFQTKKVPLSPPVTVPPMPLACTWWSRQSRRRRRDGRNAGVKHYMQRCAIQGSPTTPTEVTGQYQYGGLYKEASKHLFRLSFDELEVGQTSSPTNAQLQRQILSISPMLVGITSTPTPTKQPSKVLLLKKSSPRLLHPSAAAGLFVDAAKGPVLLNYGLEECRFTKPAYAGMTIGVRLTVKEKILGQKRRSRH